MNYKNLKELPTFGESVYQHIKKMILGGNLNPGQRIKVREIADKFNVSITPVREAIHRLSAEKYLTINSRDEVRVTSISLDEVHELFEIIKAIDVYGIKKVINIFPEEALKELKNTQKKIMESYKKNQIRQVINWSNEIHFRLWKTYGNEDMYRILVNTYERVSLTQTKDITAYYTTAIFENSSRDHSELIMAIENKDFELAEKVLTRHWSVEAFRD